MPPRATPYPATSILYVDAGRVEWLGAESSGCAGERPHGRVEVAGARPDELARAARSAWQAAHSGVESSPEPRRRPCVLALGAELARQQRIELPPLTRREARRVFHRKAANLLGARLEDTLYSARPLGPVVDGGESGERASARPWQLVALPRGFVTGLLRELHDTGFRVRRTVAARQARLSHALDGRPAPDSTSLVVDVERAAVVLSWVADGTLVTQVALAGDYRTSPSTAVALIPEARRLASFWRKHSRGGGVDEIVVQGLDRERASVLEQALLASFTGVAVRRVPPSELDGSPDDGALHGLAACAARGALAPELAVAPTRRRGARIATVLAVLTLIASAGVAVRGSMRRDLAGWDGRMRALERAAANLTPAYREAQRIERRIDERRSEASRWEATHRLGLPLSELVEDAFAAAGDATVLLSLDVEPDGEGYGLVLAGETDPEPERSWRALERLTSELERSSSFEHAELAPLEWRRSSSSGAREPLRFGVVARLEGFGPIEPASEGAGGAAGGQP